MEALVSYYYVILLAAANRNLMKFYFIIGCKLIVQHPIKLRLHSAAVPMRESGAKIAGGTGDFIDALHFLAF